MALDDGDQTRTFTQMGGEGAPFVGMAPFTDTPHVFANMGDGTYTHSGIMAIRQAVAAKAPHHLQAAVQRRGGDDRRPAGRGRLSDRTAIAAQVAAEGVARIAVVADEADRLPPASALPAGTTRHTRDGARRGAARLARVRRRLGADLRPGLRHREAPPPQARQDGAADAERRDQRAGLRELRRLLGAVELHRDRAGGDIARPQAPDQSDKLQRRSVLPEGLLPELRHRRRPAARAGRRSALAGARGRTGGGPAAAGACPSTAKPWRALFAGIGGGGIVTSGAILAMAAHLEGKAVRTLDFTGLAQKNGTVVAHVQIADDEAALDVVRIPLGTADLMIAADLAVAAGPGVLERNASSAAVIGNLDLAATAAFKHDANLLIDAVLHRRTIERATDAGASDYLHAVRLAEHLFGNAQAMNTMLLGLAWQRGLVPVGEAAILRAIELNGAAVALNRRAFLWGRILAEQPALEDEILVHTLETPPADTGRADRGACRRRWWHTRTRRWRARYRALVNEVIARETQVFGEAGAAVARRGRGPVSRDGLQGRIRGRAPARRGELRREAGVPSVAAADRRHRPGHRPAAQDRDPGLAGAAAVPRAAARQASARDGARSVRPAGRAADGAGADRAVYRRPSRRRWPRCGPTRWMSRWRSRSCPT